MKRYIVYRDDETPYNTYYGESFDSLEDAKKFQAQENSGWISKYMIIYDSEKRVNL